VILQHNALIFGFLYFARDHNFVSIKYELHKKVFRHFFSIEHIEQIEWKNASRLNTINTFFVKTVTLNASKKVTTINI
jgi:hypothetical protein